MFEKLAPKVVKVISLKELFKILKCNTKRSKNVVIEAIAEEDVETYLVDGKIYVNYEMFLDKCVK